jgi:hypothetical protein
MVELQPTLGRELLPPTAHVPALSPVRVKRPALAIPLQRADLPALSLLGFALSLLVGWFALNNLAGGFLPSTADPRAPLLFVLLQEKTITLTMTAALALLLVAAALAVAPWRWWAFFYALSKVGLRAQIKRHRQPATEPEDAEAWVAAQQAWIEAQQAEKRASADGNVATGQAADAAAPGAPGEGSTAEGAPAATTAASAPTPAADGEPGVNPAGGGAAAPAGAPLPAAPPPSDAAPAPSADGAGAAPTPAAPPAQSNDPQAPAAPQAQPQAADQAAQPAAAKAPKGVPAPPPQTSSELAKLTQNEEALNLEELSDVQDILSSFTDNDAISAELLALSASVGEVPVTTLTKHVREVNRQLRTGKRILPESVDVAAN